MYSRYTYTLTSTHTHNIYIYIYVNIYNYSHINCDNDKKKLRFYKNQCSSYRNNNRKNLLQYGVPYNISTS